MHIAVIVYSNDPETVWNAFRFANTSLVFNNSVDIFLIGKGVEVASISTLKFDIEDQLALFRANGGGVIGCGTCCESRKEEMPYLQEGLKCEMGSMQQLYSLVAEADKVLTF